MKRIVTLIGILLSSASAWAQPAVTHTPVVTPAPSKSTFARVTVYWASGGGGSDCNTRRHRCATGAHLQAGHCAVDPRRIAYGSRIHFADGICLAVDTGRDVRNRKAARLAGHTQTERNALVIDRFFETKQQALAWADRHSPFLTVQVEEPARATQKRALTRQPLLASSGALGSR